MNVASLIERAYALMAHWRPETNLVQTTEHIEKPGYIDITRYLAMPQTMAAKEVGIPTSTLSKRWKEAVPHRKWPYRAVQKLDRDIALIIMNVSAASTDPPRLPRSLESALERQLRERSEHLQPVFIRNL